MKKIVYNFLLIFFGLFWGLIICEGVLRLYNPFPTRLKGNSIVLPVNRSYQILNSTNPKLEPVITHTKNSLGFRGPELTVSSDKSIRIFCVGGSTTECFYLSDDKTWPYLLSNHMQKDGKRIWLNNAGLDGHSSFGHMVLLDDILEQYNPDYIFFLMGVNDIERSDLNSFENWNTRGRYFSFSNFLWQESELLNLGLQSIRFFRAYDKKLTHSFFDLLRAESLVLPATYIEKILEENRNVFIPPYYKRVETIIDFCLKRDIVPVLITQPALVGRGVDPVTGVNLETVKLSDALNGKLLRDRLALYNEVLKDIAFRYDIPLIDLFAFMPHSSDYFYDAFHFTNKGAEIVAEIVYKDCVKQSIIQ